MPTTDHPRSRSLPPVRVEPKLHHALTVIAAIEGRSLSDVIRAYLEDALDRREIANTALMARLAD